MKNKTKSSSLLLGSTLAQAEQTSKKLGKLLPKVPKLAIVLGSGFSGFQDSLSHKKTIAYASLPYLVPCGVKGHGGTFVFGQWNKNMGLLLLNGRHHLYEGYSPQQTTFLVMVLAKLGIKNLILTNAAGSLNPRLNPGSLMMINDHLNFPGFIGKSPLGGPDYLLGEPKFLGLGYLYQNNLFALAQNAAHKSQITLKKGTYALLAGPHFETPAEGRLMQSLGADVCGMSTVNEAIVAQALGIQVLAMSGISNKIATKHPPYSSSLKQDTTHDEVLAAGKLITQKFTLWFEKFAPLFLANTF